MYKKGSLYQNGPFLLRHLPYLVLWDYVLSVPVNE